MLDTVLALVLAAGDLLLGWLLLLPNLAAVAILALASALGMALVRRFTTDQDRLGRIWADKRRLRELIRTAKVAADRAALARHRAVGGRLALLQLAAEGRPLLVALPVLAFLGTWGWYRLADLPPVAGEPVTVELSLPPTAVGDLAHLVLPAGVEAPAGRLRELAAGDGAPAHAVARWVVAAAAQPEPYHIELVHGGRRYVQPLLVGQRHAAPGSVLHEPPAVLPQTALQHRRPRILGLLPGPGPADWGGWGGFLPAWILNYVLLVLPFFLLGKRLLRVH